MKLLGKFISVREPNIRYLGLLTMAKLAQLEGTAESIKKHQATVLVSLKDADISVRRRALDLLFVMCDTDNAERIVDELVAHLVMADAVLIFAAFLTAYYLRYQAQWFFAVDPASQQSLQGYWLLGLSTVAVLLVAFRFSHVYPYQPGRAWLTETWRIATASTAGVMIIIVVSLITRAPSQATQELVEHVRYPDLKLVNA